MEIKDNKLIKISRNDIKNNKVIVPNTVDNIGKRCFKGYKSIYEVYAPSVRIFCKEAFLNCRNLKKITFARGTWYFGSDVFKGCKLLPKLNKKIRKKIYKDVFESIYFGSTIYLCPTFDMFINNSIMECNKATSIESCFPSYTYTNAKRKFGAEKDYMGRWWPKDDMKDRINFLKWCYKQDLK